MDQHIYIATPHTGLVTLNHLRTLSVELPKMASEGWRAKVCSHFAGSILTANRNALAAEFLSLGMEWSLWLDSDMGVTAYEIAHMLALDQKIVVTDYPVKEYRWENAIGHRFNSVEALRNALLKGVALFDEGADVNGEWAPCVGSGLGCALVHRDVFTAIIGKGLAAKAHSGALRPEIDCRHYDFFRFDRDENGADIGEDFRFCSLAREAGFTVACDLAVHPTHVGLHEFRGRPCATVKTTRGSMLVGAMEGASA